MFDPQRTRRSNRKFFTKKGQVIQAKATDTPIVIEPRLVPIYRNYLIQNNLITPQPQPPAPSYVNVLNLTFENGAELLLSWNPEERVVAVTGGSAMYIIEKVNEDAVALIRHFNGGSQSQNVTLPAGCRYQSVYNHNLYEPFILNMTDGTKIALTAPNVKQVNFYTIRTDIYNPNFAIDLFHLGST